MDKRDYRWRAQVEWGSNHNSWPCRTRKEARDLVRNVKAYNRSVRNGRTFDTKKGATA